MRTRALTVVAATLLSLALTACGGGSKNSSQTPTPTTTAVQVNATSATVLANGTDQFTATVTGNSNTAVNWSVQEGTPGGTISTTGMYKAPAAAGTYHVIATSQADSTKSQPFTVTVTIPASTIAVQVTAAAASVFTSGTDQFTATVTGTTNTAVNWSVQEGTTGGTISTTGLYTPPASAGTFHVIATSQADGTTKSLPFAVAVTLPVSRTVTVSIIDNFWASGGSSPATLTGQTVGALVSGSATLIGHDNGDGTYTIAGVPAGPYWLVVGNEYFYTSSSTFDLGTDYIGRWADGNAATIPVTFSSLAIDPWVSGDALWVGSANANSWWAPTTQPTASPYSDVESIPLDPTTKLTSQPAIASGDESYALQYEWGGTGASGLYLGLSLSDGQAEAPGFTYATPVTGSLTHAATTTTMNLTTNGWPALLPPTEPALGNPARISFFGTYAWAQPYTTAPLAAIGGGMPSCINGSGLVPCATGLSGWPSGSGPVPATVTNAPHNNRQPGKPGPLYLGWVERCQSSTIPGTDLCQGAANGDAVTLSYNSPLPSSWPVVLWSQQEISIDLGVPSSFVAYSNTAVEFSGSSVPSTHTVQPVVGVVGSPKINTADFYTSASPTAPLVLSWTAPATTGGARLAGYTVMVYAVPTGGASWGSAVASFSTPNTTIQLPAGVLPKGTYAFVIQSTADATADLTTKPLRSGYPTGQAQIVSAPMTISGS